jgi:hypothetical protein
MTEKRLIPTNVPGLFKDPDTLAIINTNESEFLSYKEQVQRFRELNSIRGEVNGLKSDVSEIKEMLKTLVQMVGK